MDDGVEGLFGWVSECDSDGSCGLVADAFAVAEVRHEPDPPSLVSDPDDAVTFHGIPLWASRESLVTSGESRVTSHESRFPDFVIREFLPLPGFSSASPYTTRLVYLDVAYCKVPIKQELRFFDYWSYGAKVLQMLEPVGRIDMTI